MKTRRTERKPQENTRRAGRQANSWAVPSFRTWGIQAGLLLLAALVVLWPSASPLRHGVGHPLGEADNHRWMLWSAAQGLWGEPGPLANLPVGQDLPLMDPVHLLLYLPLGQLDAVWGMNGLAFGLVLLAGLGGTLLARELELGDAAALAGLALLASPFFAGVIDFGLTESWGLCWSALHAAFLLRFARRGLARDALGAGLALGAVALSGWYAALFGLVLEGPLVAWALARGGRRRLPGLLAQGLLALGMVLPVFRVFLQRRALWAGRFHAAPELPPPWRPDWASMPIQGTDLLNLVLPRLDADGPSKAVYLGLVPLCLSLVALVRRPRQALPLLVLVILPLSLALGPWPTLGGGALGVPGPAMLLLRIAPELSAISHWWRAVGAALPFFAVLAAMGASCLGLGPRLRLALGALLLGEAIALSPTAWPRAMGPDDLPPVLATLAALPPAADGARGVLQLPFDNGRVPFSEVPARDYDRWQVQHGLPRSESYEAVDAALARSDLVAGWQAATGLPSTLPPEQRARRASPDAPVLDQAAQVAPELERLRGWGFRHVVLHTARAPEPSRARSAVERALGPGQEIQGDLYWTLPGG